MKVFILTLLATSLLQAAVPKLSPQNPKQLLNSSSVSIGGEASTLFSILDVRRSTDVKKKVERVVIDMGDLEGRPVKGEVGFYHAELQQNPPRLILDIAQTPKSKLNTDIIQQRLQKSITIEKSTVMLDPVTNNMNMVIDLKPGTKARVFPVKGVKQTSKIVIDLVQTKNQ